MSSTHCASARTYPVQSTCSQMPTHPACNRAACVWYRSLLMPPTPCRVRPLSCQHAFASLASAGYPSALLECSVSNLVTSSGARGYRNGHDGWSQALPQLCFTNDPDARLKQVMDTEGRTDVVCAALQACSSRFLSFGAACHRQAHPEPCGPSYTTCCCPQFWRSNGQSS